ncbi:MAG: glycerol-3-phosphate O-acyltransferase [Gammaproteobacteria bacterium]|jgi:glycerol-3-phosphate O-acyltransferase
MLALRSIFYFLLKFPVRLLVRCKIIPDDLLETGAIDPSKPVFYIIRHQSASDLLALQIACKKQNLPDPLGYVDIKGKRLARTLCLEKPTPVFSWSPAGKTTAIAQGVELHDLYANDPTLDAQLIPATLIWGRTPTKEKNNASVGTLLADQESPSWIGKLFIVLFVGRKTLVRFSEALSFRVLVDQHHSDDVTARKLIRVARFHFHRQKIAATGPRLMHRQQMFTSMLASPAIKRLIEDEVKKGSDSEAQIKKNALAIMDEIAGDYRDSMILFFERILRWLWNRLYNGIEIGNAKVLRELARDGHEIIYVPCHRSHMDYLLLTYVIFHEGLVTPRIAAGINLSFWPAGPLFRRAGAFFIRRSFGGNRLYSTIFREYLSLLFERGYSVKYYTEGGRSRTGRLLAPKTGMLTMTIQSLLRGIDRPLTLVPVYIGYEHVMEVGTYHKELSGSQKKKESIIGVLKAIKNLRNYGKGYVNFGQPININQFLNTQAPDWKSHVNPIDPQKPIWLTPTVNLLANEVMTSVNKSAALNGVALVALILLSTENKALSKGDLEEQLEFFLMIQRRAPYSKLLTVPTESGADLLAQVIALGKVTIEIDSFGDMISLSPSAILEMRYYRNNILHAYILPGLICRILDRSVKVSHQDLIHQLQTLISLIKTDLFLWQSPDIVERQADEVLQALATTNIVKQSKAAFWSLTDNKRFRSNVRIMGECMNETMQRFAIICNLVSRLAPVKKEELETNIVAIAKRLLVLNNINAPEFIDKKAQANLVTAIKDQGYLRSDGQNLICKSETFIEIETMTNNLVDAEVLQSIAR